MAHEKLKAVKPTKKPATTTGTKLKSFESVPVDKWSRYQRRINMGAKK